MNRSFFGVLPLLFGLLGLVSGARIAYAQDIPAPQRGQLFLGFNPLRCAAVTRPIEIVARREGDTLSYAPIRDTLLRATADSIRMCEQVFHGVAEDVEELLNLARVKLILRDDSAAKVARSEYLTHLATQAVPVQAWANLLIIQDDTAARPVRFQNALETIARIEKLPFQQAWWAVLAGHASISAAAQKMWRDSLAVASSDRVIRAWRTLDERIKVSQLAEAQDAYIRKAEIATRHSGVVVAKAIVDSAVRDIPSGLGNFPFDVQSYKEVLGANAPPVDAAFWFRRQDDRARPVAGRITVMMYSYNLGGLSHYRLNRLVNRLRDRLGPDQLEYVLVTRTNGFYHETAPAAPIDEARYDSSHYLHEFDSAFVASHPKIHPILAVVETKYHWNIEGRRINHTSKFETDYAFSEFIIVDKQKRIRYHTRQFEPWMEEPLIAMIERIATESDVSPQTPGTCGATSVSRDSASKLLDSLPIPGKIVSEESIPSAGISIWRLSNGIRLVLKPTTFQPDQVIVNGYGWGGYSLLRPDDRATVQMANQVIGISGLGRFDRMGLRNVLGPAGVLRLGQSILVDRQEVNGVSASRGLQSLFEAFYLVFTNPRLDTAEMRMGISQARNQFDQAIRSVDHHLKDSVKAALWQRHPRSANYTASDVERITPGRTLEVLRDRFSDASGFTFTVVGDFTLDSIRPIAEQYIASLPALYRKEHWNSHGMGYPSGTVRSTFKFGTAPRSRTIMVFNSPIPNGTDVDQTALLALGKILQQRLTDSMRGQIVETFGVPVGGYTHPYPVPRTLIQVEFESQPERMSALSAVVIQQVRRLQKDGPTEEEVTSIRRTAEQDLEEVGYTNDYWMDALQAHAMSGKSFKQFAIKENPAENITLETLRAYAKRFLDPRRLVQVTQVPQ